MRGTGDIVVAQLAVLGKSLPLALLFPQCEQES